MKQLLYSELIAFAFTRKEDETFIFVPMVDVDTGKTYEVGELERKYKARFKGIYSTQEAADAEKQRLESIEDGNPAGPPLTSAEPRPWAILLAWS